MASASAIDFVSLGESINIVSNPAPWNANLVAAEIPKLLAKLSKCGLHRTRIAAQPLQGIELPYDLRTGFITAMAQEQLKAWMGSVIQVLSDEASQMTLKLVAQGIEPVRLMLSDTTNLTESEKLLADQVNAALGNGAYAAGIITAWVLVADVLKRWIRSDSDRLNRFIQALTQKSADVTNVAWNRNDDEHHSSLDAFGDQQFLQVCETAQLVDASLLHRLRQLLLMRNDSLHVGHFQADARIAEMYMGYVSQVLGEKPFTRSLEKDDRTKRDA